MTKTKEKDTNPEGNNTNTLTEDNTLIRATDLISREIKRLQRKKTLSVVEGRLLSDYTKTLIGAQREARMAARDFDLEALKDEELAALIVQAHGMVKKKQ